MVQCSHPYLTTRKTIALTIKVRKWVIFLLIVLSSQSPLLGGSKGINFSVLCLFCSLVLITLAY